MTLSIVATMSSGQITWHSWIGFLPSLQDQVEATLRNGATGTVSQIIGSKAEITTVKAWRAYDNTTDALSDLAYLQRIQGYVVDVLDPWGRSWTRVRVHRVMANIISCKGPGPSSSGAVCRIEAEMQLEPLVNPSGA